MDNWTDCNVFSTGQRGNCGSACSYCSSVTSLNNDPSSTPVHNTVQSFLSHSPL